MKLIFDTETTGLPPKGASYKQTDKFDNCRLVSICWFLVQGENVVEQSYYIIKPSDGMVISPESTAIHGITQEHALEVGKDLKHVLELFGESLKKVDTVIAHNIAFDEVIIKSELFRNGFKDALLSFKAKHQICTMIKGRLYMKVRKYPKLAELYKHLYGEDIQNAHCALDDTKYCYKCYIKLFPADPGVFYFGDKEVRLTEEQKAVVFSPVENNILMVAAAGSGKTTTVITRIKHLLDLGVNESSIILTTFTRNAASDMKDKLFEIMGYKSNIHVGTIDSFAKAYIETFTEMEITRVEDYAPHFLQHIKKDPAYIKKFKYMFVDEIQDINQLQFEIINEFYKMGVFIIGVGDDCQNIYQFRGSDIKYIIKFDRYFTPSQVFHLTKNFRSTHEIVAFANHSISRNKMRIPKDMIASNEKLLSETHSKPVVMNFDSSRKQYSFVISKIKEYLAQGIKEDAICIMAPINKPLIEFSAIMRENDIAFHYSSNQDDTKQVRLPGHVSLNTIHRAKGLEWSIVFLISMTDEQNKNIYRFNKGMDCARLLEANRRLFYVAVTRAKRQLYILCDNGDMTRFVGEVSSSLYSKS